MLRTDRVLGDQWLITDGLRAGDRLIVEGLQKIGPGAEVRPMEIEPVRTAAAAGPKAE